MCVLLVLCVLCGVMAVLRGRWLILQHPCVIGGHSCNGVLHSLTDEEWKLVQGRCQFDERITYESSVICKRHFNELLQRYKPTRCAACPQPLSASASRPCPEWMREQLHAHHGAFVHKRPCYENALAARKQPAADTRPVEVQQENEQPQQTFQIDVSQHKRNTLYNFDASTYTHKYVLCLLVCADRRIWRRTLGTICIRRLRISAD